MKSIPVFLLFMASLTALADKPSEPKLLTAKSLAADPAIQAKAPVLIAYFPDVRADFNSDFQESLQRILSALELPRSGATDDDQFLDRVRRYILADLGTLQTFADRESAAIRRHFCSKQGVGGVDVALFQSSSTPLIQDPQGWDLHHGWEFCRANSTEEGSIKRAWRLDNYGQLAYKTAWASQILSHPLIFRRALEAVRAEFPQDKYRYILYIKSHGDAEHIAALQYGFDSSNMDAQKLRDALLARKNDFVVNGTAASAFPMEVRFSSLIQEILGSVLPLWQKSPSRGIEKFEMLEMIAELGGGDVTRGMFFSQILLNSRHGGLESSTKLKPYIQGNDLTGLNIQNAGPLRDFGTEGETEFPFEKLFRQFGVPKTPAGSTDFEVQLDTLLKRLANAKELP